MRIRTYKFLLHLALLSFFSCSESNDFKRESLNNSTMLADPKIESFSFLLQKNPLSIIEDVDCQIINDSLIECRIPYIMDEKVLVPEISFIGEHLYINGEEYVGGGALLILRNQ